MSENEEKPSLTFMVSGIFLGVIVIGGLIAVIWPSNSDPGDATGHEETPAPSEQSTEPPESTDDGPEINPSLTPSDSGSLCGLEAHETEIDVLFPERGTNWTPIHGMRAPGSEAHGPGVVEDDLRYCYARTPQGAVLATANFLVLANMVPDRMDGNWDRVIAPGEGRLPLVREMESTPTADEVPGQVTAAKVVSYSEDEARISIALLSQEGERASMTLDLEWTEGDWKIDPGEDGEPDSDFTVLEDLAGFTPWSAV